MITCKEDDYDGDRRVPEIKHYNPSSALLIIITKDTKTFQPNIKSIVTNLVLSAAAFLCTFAYVCCKQDLRIVLLS